MVYGLPATGEPNWGTKVNASVEAVKAKADAAEAEIAGRLSETNLSASFARVDVTKNGVVADGVTDDSTAWASVLDSAVALGAIAVLPVGKHSRVTTPITPPSGAKIIGERGSKITQATVNTPVFDVFDQDNIWIEGLALEGGSERLYADGSFRGSQQFVYSAGIWCNGQGCTFRNLTVSNLTSGVYVTSWNGTDFNRFRVGNKIEGLSVSQVDFGVLFVGQDGLRIRDVRGTYSYSPGSGNPPHLIYGSDGAGFTSKSRQIDVANCVAFDGTTDHAFQFKHIDGGVVRGLQARNCGGLLTVMSNKDVVYQGLSSRGDVCVSTNGSIYFNDDLSERVRIRDVTIEYLGNHPIARLGGVDCTLSGLSATVTRTTVTDDAEITVNGTRFILDDVRVTNTDAAGGRRVVNIAQGSGASVSRVRGIACRAGVYVTSDVTGAMIEIDPSRLGGPTGYSGFRYVDNNASGTLIRRPNRLINYSGNGGTFTIDPVSGDYHEISITSNNSVAISNPPTYARSQGMQVTIAIANNSGGTMSTPAWGADFKFRGSQPADPATDSRYSVTFIFDGTNWQEVARAA